MTHKLVLDLHPNRVCKITKFRLYGRICQQYYNKLAKFLEEGINYNIIGK